MILEQNNTNTKRKWIKQIELAQEAKDFILFKNVDSERLNNYWYSGEVVMIEYDDYEFA